LKIMMIMTAERINF